jgi:hypothetical protein
MLAEAQADRLLTMGPERDEADFGILIGHW